jgi:hypothetical protein
VAVAERKGPTATIDAITAAASPGERRSGWTSVQASTSCDARPAAILVRTRGGDLTVDASPLPSSGIVATHLGGSAAKSVVAVANSTEAEGRDGGGRSHATAARE